MNLVVKHAGFDLQCNVSISGSSNFTVLELIRRLIPTRDPLEHTCFPGHLPSSVSFGNSSQSDMFGIRGTCLLMVEILGNECSTH